MSHDTTNQELPDDLFNQGALKLAVSAWKSYYSRHGNLCGDYSSHEAVLVSALAELAIPRQEAENIAFLASIEAQAQVLFQN